VLKPLPPSKGRLIKRRLSIQPAFHETDMMGVIHNSVYFLWFEQGRLQIMLEVLPVEEALKMGVFMPVVENLCHYRKPVKFGQPLLLYTTHHIQPAYEGRLVFSHYLIHEKQRTAMAYGQTAMTLVQARTNRLVKEWPQDLWRRYQALK
jgi:acyl-CoA thioester hydrolase